MVPLPEMVTVEVLATLIELPAPADATVPLLDKMPLLTLNVMPDGAESVTLAPICVLALVVVVETVLAERTRVPATGAFKRRFLPDEGSSAIVPPLLMVALAPF